MQGGARGALAVLAAVLGVSVSLFRLVPEVSKFDLSDVGTVILVASEVLVFLCLYLWGVSVVFPRWFRPGTRATLKVLGLTAVAWAIMGALVITFLGPSWADIASVSWTEGDAATVEARVAPAKNWMASLSPPILAAGGYWAFRTWISYRDEREQQCPWCKEWVKLDALKCRYCGSDLEPPAQEQQQEHQPQPEHQPAS